VDALKRDLLVIPHWLWLVAFTSKADKLKAGQTREGIQKTELSNERKLVLLYPNSHVTNYLIIMW